MNKNNFKIETKLDSNGQTIKYSKESGHPVEITSETNYMFKLSEFKDRLRHYLGENIIVPSNYAQALHSQIDNLEDLSVSREAERIHWGIPVTKKF
jgi:methionyl-tRNA synthetase